MQLKCPRCNAATTELIECEICKTIGCIKCITKYNKQWICGNCRSRETSQSPESALAAMFG
jgi:hypothetical protein